MPGLTKLVDGEVEVLSQGRWVPGARWSPPGSDAGVPGLGGGGERVRVRGRRGADALLGRSFDARARLASAAALTGGIDVPADVAAGRALGRKIGKLALARVGR